MDMDPQKKFLGGMLLITVFVFIVAISSLYVQTEISAGNACGCAIPLYLFIPLLASMGLLIGVLSYYMFSPRFEKSVVDKKALLKAMDPDEAKVLSVLMDGKGENRQAAIVSSTGLSKVKISRILERMQRKGMISKKTDKKVNTIILEESMRNLLL